MGLNGHEHEIYKNGIKRLLGICERDAGRWRARGKGAKRLSEKRFWEGGVIPNTCNDETSLASFQL